MSVTQNTIDELERTLRRVVQYRDEAKDGRTTGPSHALAMRATMDLTRQLALFRATPIFWKAGEPK